MAENKKRWRPSLGAYRELQKTNEALLVENESLRADNKALAAKDAQYQKDLDRLNADLEKQVFYNTQKDKELAYRDDTNNSLRGRVLELEDEVAVLEGRGFWARVFNL